MELDGSPWEQNPFAYQAKCLQWLREAYQSLNSADRGRVDNVLSGTGVMQLFN